MFLKIGHRGAAGYEPENTLRSFRKALELGVDMVELDVRRTKDGKLVVIHDDTVDRTTPGSGAVAEMTLAEIMELDAGRGEKVPILDEVLDLVRGKVGMDIEVKDAGTGPDIGRFLTDHLARGAKPDDFVVSSFLPRELAAGYYPDVRRVLLVKECLADGIKAAAALRAWGIGPKAELVDKDFVKAAHDAGLKVLPWTADESILIRKLKALGVDGIFSNFPDRL
jgi:glycerophosphoryl diester phosphodiesterase